MRRVGPGPYFSFPIILRSRKNWSHNWSFSISLSFFFLLWSFFFIHPAPLWFFSPFICVLLPLGLLLSILPLIFFSLVAFLFFSLMALVLSLIFASSFSFLPWFFSFSWFPPPCFFGTAPRSWNRAIGPRLASVVLLFPFPVFSLGTGPWSAFLWAQRSSFFLLALVLPMLMVFLFAFVSRVAPRRVAVLWNVRNKTDNGLRRVPHWFLDLGSVELCQTFHAEISEDVSPFQTQDVSWWNKLLKALHFWFDLFSFLFQFCFEFIIGVDFEQFVFFHPASFAISGVQVVSEAQELIRVRVAGCGFLFPALWVGPSSPSVVFFPPASYFPLKCIPEISCQCKSYENCEFWTENETWISSGGRWTDGGLCEVLDFLFLLLSADGALHWIWFSFGQYKFKRNIEFFLALKPKGVMAEPINQSIPNPQNALSPSERLELI